MPSLVTVGTAAFHCLVCGHPQFWERQVKLNTSGAEFLGFAWANRSSTGLICARCGYLHEFLGDQVAVWIGEGGYPEGTTGARHEAK